jgi:hypothetical protein
MPLGKQALDTAIRDGAEERAPGDLATARQKLALAQNSADNGLYDDGRRFAEEAEIDARLASARSRTVAASNALSQLQGNTHRAGPPDESPRHRRSIELHCGHRLDLIAFAISLLARPVARVRARRARNRNDPRSAGAAAKTIARHQ